MTIQKQTVMVYPGGFKGGTLVVQGDKSISHRVAMLAALASGTSKVRGYLQAEDCLNTLRAMESLGARTFFEEDGALTIHGTGGKLMEPVAPLNLGNSGTGLRLLTGLCAGYPITVQLTGDESLCSRPMKRIQAPLEAMGARIGLTPPKETAPVVVQGGTLKAIQYSLPVASAQVKSCILFAALHAEGTTTVEEPQPTRDHTERLFKAVGVPVQVDGLKISLKGFGAKGPVIRGRPWVIPGDFSSAAYWLVSAAIQPGRMVCVREVGLNARRVALLDVLRRMGADVQVEKTSSNADTEPYGDITVRGQGLHATEIGGEEIPNLIDELPLVAVLGALAKGRTVIRDAAELRVKESDRITCMATNLKAVGVVVEETPDGMIIEGPAAVKGSGSIRSYGDHRVAMSMAILAIAADGPLCINNIACVDTSYPDFWKHLETLGVQVE